jgi:cell division transport system ATP-binding protein
MIKLDKVSKKFGTGVFGLSEVSLSVEKGEFVFLVGSTGAGKTTIFKLLIRDTLPTEGSIEVNGWDVVNLPKNKIATLRKNVGVVFQDLKLLLDRTVKENVMLPLEVAGATNEEAVKIVDSALGLVGLLDHKDKFPVQLSGGELQRVAIARALVLSPEILLADEPTGNLDEATSWEIVKLLLDINKRGTTVVMATHNQDVIKSLKKRVIRLEKGKIIDKEKNKKEVEKHQAEPVQEDKKEEEKE